MRTSGCMTPKTAMESFVLCGQQLNIKPSQPVLGYENASVSFDHIMNSLYGEISEETQRFIKNQVPELIAILKVEGRLIQQNFIDTGIHERLIEEGFENSFVERDSNVNIILYYIYFIYVLIFKFRFYGNNMH
jgi:hypothetical protein